jgi:hypothetical protein
MSAATRVGGDPARAARPSPAHAAINAPTGTWRLGRDRVRDSM